MSYIPSFLKSAPQPLAVSILGLATTADATITSIDTNYSVVLFGGTNGGEASGFVTGTSFAYWKIINATTVRAIRGIAASQPTPVAGYVLEFVPIFLRQVIAYFEASVGVTAHGLTLGTKAFPIMSGYTSNYNTAASIGQSEVIAKVSIDATNITVTGGSTITKLGVFIVDPL